MTIRAGWHHVVLAAFLVMVHAPSAAWADEPAATGVDESAPADPPYAGWQEQDVRQLLRAQDAHIAELSRRDVLALYDGFLAACPENAIAQFLQARVRGGRSGLKAMRRLLETRLGLPVTRAAEVGAGWDALARLHVEVGENEDALEAARFAAQLVPSADQQAFVGWIARRLEQDDLAIQAYIAGLRLDRAHLGCRYALVPLLLERGDAAEALQLAEATLRLDAESPLAHLHHGMVLGALGRVEDAKTAYEKALENTRDDPDRIAAIAAALRRIEHADLAELALRVGIDRHPEHFGLLTSLALLHMDREAYPLAIDLLERAKRLDVHDARLPYLLGLCYERSGRAKRAIGLYKRALQMDGEELAYRLGLGSAYRADDSLSSAIAVYREATRKFPESAEAQGAYARALYDAKEYSRAAKEYERLIKLQPLESDPRFLFALILGPQLGKEEDAYRSMCIYEELGGKDPNALSWLASLRQIYERR
ncbi:MAG: tetratricopeptide repeat protein [Planctomycetota bacterium]